ncbi:metallophosphoesterase family protein [Spongorhabdus nitratireducens]
MRTQDLGELNGPVLVFGGPYSNLQATQAIKAIAEQHNIPVQNIICTGDTVAYCAEPEETVQLIKEWGIAVIEGNCEESFGNDLGDCGCGFESGTQCDLLSAQWYRYAASRLSNDSRQWLRTRPQKILFSLAGKRFTVIHGSMEQNNHYIFASTSEEEKRRNLQQAGTDVIIGGHCGLPFYQQIGDKLWLNPGVIGMPANDGTPDGWYALLTPSAENSGLDIRLERLSYPFKDAAQAMVKQGLKAGYHQTLITGIWPSLDILPEEERKQQDIPLETGSILLL